MASLEVVNVTKVYLAEPRGFCAGVEKAIKALAWMVRVLEPPIYCYHEIVHNQVVVERFKDLGVVFVQSISDVPAGAPVMLSAHGTAPQVVNEALDLSPLVVNAVCPLVTKVHHEVRVRAQKGYEIIYVGHKNHDEAVGTSAVAPSAVHLIESVEEFELLEGIESEVALVAQTTLAMDEWAEIREEVNRTYPKVWMPSKSDLCFATTNRQSVLKSMANRCSTVVVVGSANSSNTVALTKVATASGVARVIRVNTAAELPKDISGVVGVTAGASAPDELIDEVIRTLNPTQGVEVVTETHEDEYFPPPPELRDLMKNLFNLASVAFGREIGKEPTVLSNDRRDKASDVLLGLTKLPR